MIHRQENVDLIYCVNDLEIGRLCDESIAFINSLSHPLPTYHNNQDPVHLFAKYLGFDLFNYERKQNMPGNLRKYESKDEVSKHYPDIFFASKTPWSEKMCPVKSL